MRLRRSSVSILNVDTFGQSRTLVPVVSERMTDLFMPYRPGRYRPAQRDLTMKRISLPVVAVAFVVMSMDAGAGLFGAAGGCKSCGCAEECQPRTCSPTITRPCHVNVFSYQRACANSGTGCCDVFADCCAPAGCHRSPSAAACHSSCCAPMGSGPVNSSCCAPTCCSPACCAPVGCCSEGPADCCAPACCASTCCAPEGCGQGAFCCGEGCGSSCCTREGTACYCLHRGKCSSRENCRDIAELIYESMTACYAKDRRTAVHRLGDHFDCCCHPEIMNAFIYALNDSDERVRAKAADEIGDQVRRNRCRCGSPVICALTHALADCDRHVRRQAEEALQACGYKIVDGQCRQYCCPPSRCGSGDMVWSHSQNMTPTDPAPPIVEDLNPLPAGSHSTDSVTDEVPKGPVAVPAEESGVPAPAKEPSPSAPAETSDPDPPAGDDVLPAPEEKPQAYFPSRLRDFRPKQGGTGLSKLLGLQRS